MTAATYNAVECLDVLLEFDPDLDVINPSGKTALMLACQSGIFYRVWPLDLLFLIGHIEITIRLLDEDAGLTAGEGSSTPLHWAVDSNSVSIVRRLIEYDCDVNAIDETSSVSKLYHQYDMLHTIWTIWCSQYDMLYAGEQILNGTFDLSDDIFIISSSSRHRGQLWRTFLDLMDPVASLSGCTGNNETQLITAWLEIIKINRSFDQNL